MIHEKQIESVATIVVKIFNACIEETEVIKEIIKEHNVTSSDIQTVINDPEQFALMIDELSPQLIDSLDTLAITVEELENE